MASDLAGERAGEEQEVAELQRALRGSERRFEAIVGALSDAVTIRDREHRFLYANRAALAHLGFDTWEQLRDTPPSLIMSDYLVWGADGREITMQDIPSVRILNGEHAEPLLIRTVNRTTGVQRWNLLKAAPLLDEDGEVDSTITIIEEVTAQRRSELGNSFLADAATELASSLDYEQTLRNVADLAVPDIADWCAVDLLDQDGDRRTVAVAHVDPERLSLAEALRRYVPDQLDPAEGLGRVLSTGEPTLYPEITEEMLAQSAVDERHLELLRAVGLRSVLIVPMRIGERILGALTLVSAESIVVFDQFDLQLAERVASRAAVAIENSRLYSERSMVARTLQQSLLPEELPSIPGHELASIYLPARETSTVGGDFYDVWPVGGGWMMLIGDVTGKGVQAAALTALVRHTVRTAAEFDCGPAELLAIVDRTLKQRPLLSVCTALCMQLAGEAITIAVGGHPLPLQITSRGVRAAGEHGPLLGAFPGARWTESRLDLDADATLVAYTDGFTDAQDERGERFGLQRLCDALAPLAGRSASDFAAAMAGGIEAFESGEHADDRAALVLRRDAGGEGSRARARTNDERL